MQVTLAEKTDLYVDEFTYELFANYTKSSYNRIADDLSYSATQYYEALVEDAREFIELVNNEFDGISIDYPAEAYAHHFIEDQRQ